MPNRSGFIGLDVIVFAGVLIGSIVIGVTTIQNRNSIADTRSQAACASNEIFCGGCINGCRRNTQTCNRWIDQECNTSTECAGNGVVRGDRQCCPGLIPCNNGRCGTTCEAPSTPIPTQRAVCNATLRNECAQDNKVCVIEDNRPTCVSRTPTPLSSARQYQATATPTPPNCPDTYQCMEFSDITGFGLQTFNQYTPCPTGQRCARSRVVPSPTPILINNTDQNTRYQKETECARKGQCVSISEPVRCIPIGGRDTMFGANVECYARDNLRLWEPVREQVRPTEQPIIIQRPVASPTPTPTPTTTIIVVIPRNTSTPTPSITRAPVLRTTSTPSPSPSITPVIVRRPTVISTPTPIIRNTTAICNNESAEGCRGIGVNNYGLYKNTCYRCGDDDSDGLCVRKGTPVSRELCIVPTQAPSNRPQTDTPSPYQTVIPTRQPESINPAELGNILCSDSSVAQVCRGRKPYDLFELSADRCARCILGQNNNCTVSSSPRSNSECGNYLDLLDREAENNQNNRSDTQEESLRNQPSQSNTPNDLVRQVQDVIQRVTSFVTTFIQTFSPPANETNQ